MAASAMLLLNQVNRTSSAAGYIGSLPPGGPDPWKATIVIVAGTIGIMGLIVVALDFIQAAVK